MPDSALVGMPIDLAEAFEPAIRSAWKYSALANLSPFAQHALIETAVVHKVPAGLPIPMPSPESWFSPDAGQASLLVDGLVRVFVNFGDRQVTVQYAADGEIFGVPSLCKVDSGRGFSAHAQALTDSHVVNFSSNTIQQLLETDISMAQMTVSGLRICLYESISFLAENVLWPLRQRVARHLLDLAVRRGDEVIVPATVQSIADATGSVREVVTRLLKSLREEGLITRSSGHLTLLDLRALHEVARGDKHLSTSTAY